MFYLFNQLNIADQNNIIVREDDEFVGGYTFHVDLPDGGGEASVRIRYHDEPVCRTGELAVNARMLFLDIDWARIRLQTDFRLCKGFAAEEHRCGVEQLIRTYMSEEKPEVPILARHVFALDEGKRYLLRITS